VGAVGGGKRRACVLPERLRDASCLTIEQNVERTIFYFSYLRFRLRPTAAFNKILLGGLSSLLSVMFVHAAGCDTQDSLTRGGLCGKLDGRPSQLLFALQQSSIDSQLFVENRDVCLLHLHSTPPLAGSPSEYCHDEKEE